jgi:hypothetical protein
MARLRDPSPTHREERCMEPVAFNTLVRLIVGVGTRRRLLARFAAHLPVAGLVALREETEARGRHHGHHRGHHPGKGKKNRKGKRNGGKGRRAGKCDVCTVSGKCPHTSIQAAHDAANAGDTLTLCAGTYTENVTISKPLTLASRKGETVTLQATSTGSVVTIQPDATTTLTKMWISGGNGTLINGVLSGGGIVNYGTLTVNGGTIVTQNTAARGGGIYNATNGTLTILGNGTFVARNMASADGGGIYNDRGATLTIDNALVGKNTATGNGGGIYNTGLDATVTIQNNAQIQENIAAQGAGIYSDIGIDSPGTTIVTITDSSVTQNQASQAGGGIFNVAATVSLKTSTIFNNVATITGGGILNTEGGVVTLDAQSAVLDNTPDNCVGTNACPA